jgi:hypothetical protein
LPDYKEQIAFEIYKARFRERERERQTDRERKSESGKERERDKLHIIFVTKHILFRNFDF